MKKVTLPLRLLLATAIVSSSFFSCTKMDKDGDPPPVSIPYPQDCQITNLFFYPSTETHIGFPELFTSPMQGWNIGIDVNTFDGNNNPATGKGTATATWEWLSFAYNTDGTVKEIVQHAYRAPGFCPTLSFCEQVYLFDYDNNGNPVKITGDHRDFNGNSLGTYPVADNTFDVNGRLLQQSYPNGDYWRFEYQQGNLFKLYFKSVKEGTEKLKYQFTAYDSKINWAKTNPMWRIYCNTYSDNNPVSFHQFTGKQINLPTGGSFEEFIDVKVDYTYGAKFGNLPTVIDFVDAGSGEPFFKTPATITYQCKPIKVGE